jgi:hypothetical protein
MLGNGKLRATRAATFKRLSRKARARDRAAAAPRNRAYGRARSPKACARG